MKTLMVETFYWNLTYSYMNAHQRSINQIVWSLLEMHCLPTVLLSVSVMVPFGPDA